ncbi:MAG: DUF2634 domain-containing protein [Clostridiales bacterium]|nr:DUF2634 domain-containing protein [Clostridiales bacterium]
MIPNVNTSDIIVTKHASKTYNISNPNIAISNLDAVKQTVFIILSTKRYEHAIFSWNYGCELDDLTGKPNSFLYPELERRITEALTQDDRINDINNFVFESVGSETKVRFTVRTIYGSYENEVMLDV